MAKVNGKTITEADMRLAEAEVGNDLGSLPDATKRRVLLEFLIENQLFANAAEGQKLGAGRRFGQRMQYWRRRALSDVYFDKTVKAAVNDADARKFYEHRRHLKSEEEVSARHILVESREKARSCRRKSSTAPTSPSSPRRIPRTRAPRIRAANSGSSGGPNGAAVRGRAFKLKHGEIGQPFETQFGWHIIKVDERRQRVVAPFEAVKDR